MSLRCLRYTGFVIGEPLHECLVRVVVFFVLRISDAEKIDLRLLLKPRSILSKLIAKCGFPNVIDLGSAILPGGEAGCNDHQAEDEQGHKESYTAAAVRWIFPLAVRGRLSTKRKVAGIL